MNGLDALALLVAFLALVGVLAVAVDYLDERYQRYIDLQRNRLTRSER